MQCAIVPQSFNDILFINYKRIFFLITPKMELLSGPVVRTPGFHRNFTSFIQKIILASKGVPGTKKVETATAR